MTLLAFVGQLATATLSVAKSGFLGTLVSRNVNKLNYQLSFLSEYPPWFAPVRKTTTVLMFGFVFTFAALLLLIPIPTCPEDPHEEVPSIFVNFKNAVLDGSIVTSLWK